MNGRFLRHVDPHGLAPVVSAEDRKRANRHPVHSLTTLRLAWLFPSKAFLPVSISSTTAASKLPLMILSQPNDAPRRLGGLLRDLSDAEEEEFQPVLPSSPIANSL